MRDTFLPDNILDPIKVDPSDFKQTYDLTGMSEFELAGKLCICYYEIHFGGPSYYRYFVSAKVDGGFAALKQIFANSDPGRPEHYAFTMAESGNIEVVSRFKGELLSIKFNTETYRNAGRQANEKIRKDIEFFRQYPGKPARAEKFSAGDGTW